MRPKKKKRLMLNVKENLKSVKKQNTTDKFSFLSSSFRQMIKIRLTGVAVGKNTQDS